MLPKNPPGPRFRKSLVGEMTEAQNGHVTAADIGPAMELYPVPFQRVAWIWEEFPQEILVQRKPDSQLYWYAP